jgi:hypothetical protein
LGGASGVVSHDATSIAAITNATVFVRIPRPFDVVI